MLLAALDRYRSDKNVLIERYRRLLRSDPEAETKFSVVLLEVSFFYNLQQNIFKIERNIRLT